jgi:hypothetical protein
MLSHYWKIKTNGNLNVTKNNSLYVMPNENIINQVNDFLLLNTSNSIDNITKVKITDEYLCYKLTVTYKNGEKFIREFNQINGERNNISSFICFLLFIGNDEIKLKETNIVFSINSLW